MIKIFISVVFSLFFLVNLNANERELQLNNLFNQLKKVNNSKTAYLLEKRIWDIWHKHPNNIKLTIVIKNIRKQI